MGKIIIDTPDASYYYCGNCAEKVSYNHSQCSNCKKELKKEKSFQVSSDFDPSLSIIEQLNIFETAEISDGSSNIKTTKKLQVNSEGASYFYCKNCNEAMNRTALQCPNCNFYFSSIINIDSAPTNISSHGENNPFDDLDTFEPEMNVSSGQIDKNPPKQTEGEEKDNYQYVGFWKRTVAYLIDTVAVVILIFVIAFFAFLILYSIIADDIVNNFADGIANLVSLIIPWIYFAAWESSNKQATPGKMAINAKVVDIYGQRISFAHAIGRYFFKGFSFILLGIGLIMVGITKRKQGLHDKISKTLVVS